MPLFRRAGRTAFILLCTLSIVIASQPLRAQENEPTATPFTYRVTFGDTLLRIALQYGITWQELAAANQIADINNIYIGQRLIIPITTTPSLDTNATLIMLPTSTPLPTETPVSPTLTVTPSLFVTPISSLETATPITASGALDSPATPSSLNTPSMMVMPVSTIVLVSPVPPTATPTVTLTPTITPTSTVEPPTSVNGLPIDQFILLDDATRDNIRAIYARGQELGRNPHAFSKVGDSTVANGYFLNRFDNPNPNAYNLGDYAYLQPVIDYFAGSFGRNSIAVRVGLHTWSVLDPMWADPYTCNAGESLLACEIRRNNPAVIIIRLGSNDVGVPRLVENNLREIVEFCILNGIIPIIGTKADRFDGAANQNNEIMRQIAREYHIPLWDFDLVAGTIPGRGLLADSVHLTTTAHDYTQPYAFQAGYTVHNLTALIALDAVMEALGVAP